MRYIILSALLFFLLSTPTSAEQYVSGNHVIHTRLAPVVAHRVLPPFRGVHVYQGRVRR